MSRRVQDNSHPPSFLCPLTYEIMNDPVVDLCAHSFERSAIVDWIEEKGNACCPISRKALSVSDLVTNHVLAERIEKWQWRREMTRTEQWKQLDGQLAGTPSIPRQNTPDSADEAENLRAGSMQDVELGRTSFGRGRGRFGTKQPYQPIPSRFMLLPQEIASLDRQRSKDEEAKMLRRKSWQKLICISLTITTLLVFAGLAIAKGLLKAREDTELMDDEV
jgi:hypothetical protein